MKKAILLLFFVPLIFNVSAQDLTIGNSVNEWLTDSLKGDKFGSYLYVLPENKMAFYYSAVSSGLSTSKEGYRLSIAEVHPTAYSLHGRFEDYYLLEDKEDWFFMYLNSKDTVSKTEAHKERENNMFFKDHRFLKARVGSYKNGVKHGYFLYYYLSGELQARGKFNNGKREGIWEFFYEDGLKYKVINYDENEEETLLLLKNRRGKDKLKEGKGKFKDEVYLSGTEVRVEGKVLNGKPDGKWKGYLTSFNELYFIEEYEEGKLISAKHPGLSGYSKDSYYTSPKVTFNTLVPFTRLNIYETDHTFNFENNTRRYGYIKNSEDPFIYANSSGNVNGFYEEVQQGFSKVLEDRDNLLNGYFLVEAKILKDGNIGDIHLYSTFKDKTLENHLKELLKARKRWVVRPGTEGLPLAPVLFFQVIVNNNKVYIHKLTLENS